jgi:hypothetical protein
MSTFKKQPYIFYQTDYNAALRKYELDNSRRKKIRDFFFETTGRELTDVKNIAEQLYNHIEQTATDNVMKLDIKTYCKLKGIDFTFISELENIIETWEAPNIDAFTCFTENEKENERLADFIKLKKEFTKFTNKYNFNPNLINASLRSITWYDPLTNDVYPTQPFIKAK